MPPNENDPSTVRPPKRALCRDYPAAHSMDTAWYAVDLDGNIGRFETGEAGALPKTAAHEGGPDDANFDVEALVVALSGAARDEDADDEMAELPGIFQFHQTDHYDPGGYSRDEPVPEPRHISSLDPALRAAVEGMRLPVRFGEVAAIHLDDHLTERDVHMWTDGPLRVDPDAMRATLAARRLAEEHSVAGRIGRLPPIVKLGAGLLVIWLGMCAVAWYVS